MAGWAHVSSKKARNYVLCITICVLIYAISFGAFIWANTWANYERANVFLLIVDGSLVVGALLLSVANFSRGRRSVGRLVLLALGLAVLLSAASSVAVFAAMYGGGGD